MNQLAIMLVSFSAANTAAVKDPVGNWFNDPFFQISNQSLNRPVPKGPTIPKFQVREQAHQRTERGTSRWLVGVCKKPNAYMCDADIAQSIREMVGLKSELARGSLLITVQRRFV